ncbi:MAG: Zn-dependent hydrolase [Alphaproteobacteria bacterium]
MREPLRANGERLWSSLMEMAAIGATAKGGVCRLALTDFDRQARDLFVRWGRECGCEVDVDAIGNIFVRRPGRDRGQPSVLIGSHLDTQPTGGKFDGVYGVMAALEIVRTLNDHGIETLAPIEAVSWTNEEGSRFAPPMTGSGVFAGEFELEEMLAVTGQDSVTIGEELARIGYSGESTNSNRALNCFLELHIEQGPVLENEGLQIGIVTHAQGQVGFEVFVKGVEGHSGTLPMPMRHDALVAAAQMVTCVEEIAKSHAPRAVGTVGVLNTLPNSRTTIPGYAEFTIDLRHPDDATLTAMEADVHSALVDIAEKRGIDIEVRRHWRREPQLFDTDCVELLRQAAALAKYEAREMISGAGHDACYLNKVTPTAMIFVPCKNGISHNESEYATPENLAAGCDVLLTAVLLRAGRV